MSLTINREYAIILAKRGRESFEKRAHEEDKRHVRRLVAHGLPNKLIPFIKSRMTENEASEYVRVSHSRLYHHFIALSRPKLCFS